MKFQALILLAGTEQAAASSYSNLDPEVVQCSSTTGSDSIENQTYKSGIYGRFTGPHKSLILSELRVSGYSEVKKKPRIV